MELEPKAGTHYLTGLPLITWNVDKRPQKNTQRKHFHPLKMCPSLTNWQYSSRWQSPSLLGEKEPDDEDKEEEQGDGNVALQTIKVYFQPLIFLNTSWCGLLSEIEFSIPVCFVSSLHMPPRHQKKSYLITQAWNKEILQLCMALDGTFSLTSFFSFNLFMSLWFHCSHTAVQRQSSTNCGNRKAFWGYVEIQVCSASGSGTKPKCFPLFWPSLCF